ncbi:hypothetical protein LMG28614_00077 [Paraburkholderia ultramafica]|uniref:Sulfotransferase domain-containing protein n=2 Tax=Paraburkholderia ultramafica TaxID=1544867 RepID=A0A6S7ARR6_9BURK|nr:hypothetical protein LMG28614_00077 [Paraburkholderia ultramafica]
MPNRPGRGPTQRPDLPDCQHNANAAPNPAHTHSCRLTVNRKHPRKHSTGKPSPRQFRCVCLDPQARFIHIHRDPRQVANSLLHKHWIGSIDDAVRVWGQYVGEILDFFEGLPAGFALTIPYRGLIENPDATGASIGSFLGLADASPISDFQISQRHAPTPFSDPVTDIADLYVIPSKPAGDDKLLALAGSAATHLGYAAP